MAANYVEIIFTWYFRLNGYFTTPNFTVHKDYKKKPGGGEADLLAVRFPYSKEEPRDYPFFRDDHLILENKTDFVIVEIKSGKCTINPSWLNEDYRNIEYAIKWMGFRTNDNDITIIANQIRKTTIWQPKDENIVARIIACGKDLNTELNKQLPDLKQIELHQAVQFLHDRFNTGCNQINRSNWDDNIEAFADLCQKEHDIEKLKKWILEEANAQ